MDPRLLDWIRQLQSLAQNGLAYTHNDFDRERFEQIRRIAAEMLAASCDVSAGDLHPATRLDTLFAGEEGYATPKVDVRGAAFRDGKILLVQEMLDQGRWTLPGGWADTTDTPAEAVVREMREEAGFEVRPVKLAAVYDRNRRGHPPFYFSIYKLFFTCEILAPVDRSAAAHTASNVETGEVAFFAEDALPELSISRVTPQEIHMLFAHYRRPELPTEFD